LGLVIRIGIEVAAQAHFAVHALDARGAGQGERLGLRLVLHPERGADPAEHGAD
jgi:hypothetical protein